MASDPVAAQICGYEPGPRAARATLRGVPARTLALLLNEARPGRPRAPACTGGVNDLVSLVYRARIITVTLKGCPSPVVASGDGRSWELSRPAADAIGGAAFTLGSGDISTPSFLGLDAAHATRAARAFAPGTGAGVGGEIVDPQQPFGSVVWQEPLPGVRQTKPPQADLLVAVAPEPPCAASQLAGRYLNAGNGTGNHFGNIVLLDISSHPCRISGRITLTGLDQAGRSDTVAATEALEPPLVLSPEATPRAVLARPASALAAIFGFSAEVRDDPRANGGLCYTHESYPATWSLRLGREAPLRFANGGPGSGGRFFTCHGNFGFYLGSPFGLYS